MNLRDRVEIACGNLRRMKLRAFLTISGVVIALGAFVSMLSFGAGSHRRMTGEFEQLGLFNTMHVYPVDERADGETEKPDLDGDAIETLARLPGVNLAYPFETFQVEAAFGDTTIETEARALPERAARTKLFTSIMAGRPLDDDSDGLVLVTEEFLRMVGGVPADSVVGRRLVLTVRKAVLDSAMVRVFDDRDGRIGRELAEVRPDSIMDRDYRRRMLRRGFATAAERFLEGLREGRHVVRDTFEISGVIRATGNRRFRTKPVLVPMEAARLLGTGSVGAEPTELLAALAAGTLFEGGGDAPRTGFPRITLDLHPRADHGAVADSIEAIGFRVFSYARQFDEIRRVYIFFELGLAVVGLIALATASLGIVNTMVMSISERKREIGILKSLGADEGEIQVLFLVESGVIGVVGAAGGIVLGWIVARIASFVFRMIMERQGIPPMDMFATPLWLVALAFVIGIGVSLAAGSYPAARAARVDPVEALRSD